jgi:hypothetical protein
MADTNAPSGGFTLRPPSQQMIDQRLNEQRFGAGRAGSLPFDPRTQDQRGPDAGPPPMAPITMEAEAQPSRVTGRFEELTPDQQRALSDPNLAQRAIGGFNQFKEDSGLGALSRGFNDIVLALPDMAINAIASGLESAGIVEEGAVDRNFLNRVFNSSDYRTQRVIIPYVLNYGVDDYIGQTEAEGNFDKYMRAGGQGVGIAAPFIGMTSRGAQLSTGAGNVINAAGQRVMPATATTTERVVEQMFAPYRRAPAATAALEAGFGAVSAMGVQAERDLFGTSTGIGGLLPLAPVALYYSGKTAVTQGPIGRGVNWVSNRIGGAIDEARVNLGTAPAGEGPRGAAARGQLGKAITQAVETPQGQANIARAAEIESRLSPYADQPVVLTPAERTMDVPLLETQRRAEATGSPDFTRQNADRKTNALTAIENFREGELTGNPLVDAPLYILDEATGQYRLTIAPIDEGLDDVTFQLSRLADADTGAYPRLSDRRPIGQTIRETVVNAHRAVMEQARTMANRLNINNADQLASRDATATARQVVRDLLLTRQGEEALSYEGLPRLVRQFVESDLDRISFQDWKSFRDQVSQEIGRTMALGRGTDTRALTVLAEQLDDMASAYGRTSQKFEDYRQWYQANVIQPFERSGVIAITARGQGGTKAQPVYYLPDERVAQTFLENSDTARQFIALFGDNPERLGDIRAVVLDQIRDRAYDSARGTFRPNAVDTYMNRNREVLQNLGLYDELSNTQGLLTAQLERQAELTARRRAINQNQLFRAIASAEGRNDPERLLDEALRNPALMGDLRQTVTRPGPTQVRADMGISADDAAEAFRAAVTQRLFANAPDAMANPASFKEFLVRNERVLDAAFDQSHINNMYLVADAAERVLATGMPVGKGVMPEDIITRLTNRLGTTPAGISNRFIAVQEGRLGPKAAIGYVLSRAIRQQSSARADALFREMMFNPDLARTLTTEGPAPLAVSEPIGRRINAYMFNVGVDYGEGMEAGPPAPPIQIEMQPALPDQGSVTPPAPPIRGSGTQTAQATPPVAPTPAPVTPAQIAPPAMPPASGATTGATTPTVSASQLFPFDPTLAAIEQRRTAQGQGIMSLGQ